MTIKILAILALGAILGTITGYLGSCASGQCPLTSTPIRGAIWGTVLAAIFAFGTKN